jgi:hypothetical protein
VALLVAVDLVALKLVMAVMELLKVAAVEQEAQG